MSQVSPANNTPSTDGALSVPNSCRVAIPNNTVDKIRVQLRPWLFARAIHSHSAVPSTP